MDTTISGRRYNAGKPRTGLIPINYLDASLVDSAELREHIGKEGPVSAAIDYVYNFLAPGGELKDLLHAFFALVHDPKSTGYPVENIMKLADVYTRGADKYTDRDENGKVIYDGTFNWSLGMSWVSVADSLTRHLWKSFVEENDEESGQPHVMHALWGIVTLITYVHEHPRYDDRRTAPAEPRIGLDIDGPCADFNGAFVHWLQDHGMNIATDYAAKFWDDHIFRANFPSVAGRDDFWSSIPPTRPGELLKFEPVVYITSRPCSVELTTKWLNDNGFPSAPVVNVYGTDDHHKIAACRAHNVELFIDDKISTYRNLNAMGIPCLLFDRPHNHREKAGCRRVNETYLYNVAKPEPVSSIS